MSGNASNTFHPKLTSVSVAENEVALSNIVTEGISLLLTTISYINSCKHSYSIATFLSATIVQLLPALSMRRLSTFLICNICLRTNQSFRIFPKGPISSCDTSPGRNQRPSHAQRFNLHQLLNFFHQHRKPTTSAQYFLWRWLSI